MSVAYACFAVIALFGLAFRVWFMRARIQALSGPRLYERFSRVLDPYEGEHVPPEVLDALQKQLNELFIDALTGVGVVPSGWEIQVVLDEVLGPVAEIHGQTGEMFSVAEFEQRLRDGRLELAVAAERPPGEGVYRRRSM